MLELKPTADWNSTKVGHSPWPATATTLLPELEDRHLILCELLQLGRVLRPRRVATKVHRRERLGVLGTHMRGTHGQCAERAENRPGFLEGHDNLVLYVILIRQRALTRLFLQRSSAL